ncbi:digestive organ expansion factor [Lactarius akahatsu]|uniref:U3 small nucleolar RNA-associated protein 25 n=1 Tax=Lactarius akahatsu TaxID=416441 RepID=A0AAD4Q8A5_9AGAM|nr:digestive organ expansion factor [Lactarius akahatsu]KAH8980236.1 digestive organ expansion factor [Lactarius akahatsu]
MDSDDWNSPTTKLLTLLNVSAAKSMKRKCADQQIPNLHKPDKRRVLDHISPNSTLGEANADGTVLAVDSVGEQKDGTDAEVNEATESSDTEESTYEQHFGPAPSFLNQSAIESVNKCLWSTSASTFPKIGPVAISKVTGLPGPEKIKAGSSHVLERLRAPFEKQQARLPADDRTLSDFPEIDLRLLQDEILSILTSHCDLYHTCTPRDATLVIRESISLHLLDHITKKRRRVLKNNERLAHAAKAGTPAPEDVQDQGFTRPSVLILLPFRSSGLRWLESLIAHTPPPAFQIENITRFRREFGLPEGVVDKFASAEPDAYPPDHVETFGGNPDDNFRVGLKLTRKSVRLFTEFYGSDIIIASPLGLRMSIEKEKNSDFLSSIEIVVADQIDALTMQNWEHTQFVFTHLNQLPKESHDADISRIKPWYLDGRAAYIRQTVMLSAYETPEIRSLYNQSLKNPAGKVRAFRRWAPVQNFIQFDCLSAKDELDKRFSHFANQLLPIVLKSAVQSTNTVIFVPSSLDFTRIRNHFQKQQLSFAVLSEYSTNQDISRARQAFFSGKKSFLIVSERFHFYRRYKIRGIRNLVFYGPPDHAPFYTEFLSYPFLDDGVEPSDVTCRVLYSRYDWFRMERIAGTKGASQLIKSSGP